MTVPRRPTLAEELGSEHEEEIKAEFEEWCYSGENGLSPEDLEDDEED
jgi:hypothetical protein